MSSSNQNIGITTERKQLIESQNNSGNKLFSPQNSQRQHLNQNSTDELSVLSGNNNINLRCDSNYIKSKNTSQFQQQSFMNASPHINSNTQRNISAKEELFFLTKEMNHIMRKVKGMERLKNIKTQFYKILQNTESRRKQQLNKQQLSRINDKAIVIKFKQVYSSFGQRLSHFQLTLDEKVSNFICCSKVFHPYNSFNLINNIVENIMIIMCLFLYTLFCFFDFFQEDFFFWVVIASLIVFSSGTFLRINTGYFDQGIIIFDRKKIIYKYRTEIMLYDLIAFVGQIYQLFQNDNHQVTKILCFLLITKYKVYLYNLNKIEERMNLNGNMVYVWQLIKMVSTTLALCHFVGTAFFWIAVMEKFYLDQYSWVEAQGFWDEPIHYQYVLSFYQGLAIITLIGVESVTELETIFTICSLVYTVGIFATILSTISTIYEEMDAKIKDYKKDRDTLNSFFEVHRLSNDIQGQLQNYLKYNFQGCKEMNVSTQFDELMKRLPSNLQDLVRRARYSGYVQKMDLFTKHFSNQVIQQLITYVKEEYYMPNQVIMEKNDTKYDTKICFILQGEVESYYECNKPNKQSYKQPIKIYKKGEHFGQEQFFTNGSQFYSYKSKEGQFVTCLTIDQLDFLNIISQNGFNKDLEKYYEIRDRLKFQIQSNVIDQNCTLCNCQEHIDQNCNIVFYQANKSRLIAQLNYSENNLRAKYNRKQHISRQNNLSNLYQIFEDQQRIINDPENRQYIKVIQEYQKELENEYDLQIYDINSSDTSSLNSRDDLQSHQSNRDYDYILNQQQQLQQQQAQRLHKQKSSGNNQYSRQQSSYNNVNKYQEKNSAQLRRSSMNQSSGDLLELDEQLVQQNSQQVFSKKKEIITSKYQFIQDKNFQQPFPKRNSRKNTFMQHQYQHQSGGGDKFVLNIPYMGELKRQQTLKASVLQSSGDQNFIANSISNHSQFNQFQPFPKSPYARNNKMHPSHKGTFIEGHSPSIMKYNIQNMLQEIQGQISDFYLQFLKSLQTNQNDLLNEENDSYSFYFEMDKVQNYTYYFPEYNQINVIKRFQQIQRRKVEKQKKLRKKQIKSKQQDMLKQQKVLSTFGKKSSRQSSTANKLKQLSEEALKKDKTLQ